METLIVIGGLILLGLIIHLVESFSSFLRARKEEKTWNAKSKWQELEEERKQVGVWKKEQSEVLEGRLVCTNIAQTIPEVNEIPNNIMLT